MIIEYPPLGMAVVLICSRGQLMLGRFDEFTIKIMSDVVDYISTIVTDRIKIFNYNVSKLGVTYMDYNEIGYMSLQDVSIPIQLLPLCQMIFPQNNI